ncbi:hypothetical protein F4804DRAFT_333735 [Jackrogersella minutella]|nr:hypothetical protein F4804DRAFT_333735 [Jackrogersella minutella]
MLARATFSAPLTHELQTSYGLGFRGSDTVTLPGQVQAKVQEVKALTIGEDRPKFHMKFAFPEVLSSHHELNQPASFKQLETLIQACKSEKNQAVLKAIRKGVSATAPSSHRGSILQLLTTYPSISLPPPPQLAAMLPPMRPRGRRDSGPRRTRQPRSSWSAPEQARRDSSLPLGPALLFVGCRGKDHALYATEMEGSDVVNVRYAYSREHKEGDAFTGYIQDRVWADRDDLVQLWDRGARVYVCGSRDVSQGVKEVVCKIYRDAAERRCGAKTEAEIDEWWIDILRDRYAVDVF